MKYLFVLSILLLSIASSTLYGQKVISFSPSILHENIIHTPLQERFLKPNHLGGSIAIEVSNKKAGAYQFTHVFQAAYFHHQDLHHLAFLAWKPKFELRLFQTLGFHFMPGIAYAHSFSTNPGYRLQDGAYQEESSLGHPHFMPSLGAGLGLQSGSTSGFSSEVFARYELYGIYPYSERLPFIIGSMISLGIRFSFEK